MPVLYFSTIRLSSVYIFFFFNDTATTEIYTLSLHDALPISIECRWLPGRSSLRAHVNAYRCVAAVSRISRELVCRGRDRKSTRLNSSHLVISYAVFCLKKKNNILAPRRFSDELHEHTAATRG